MFYNSLKLANFNLKRTWFSSMLWIIVLLSLTIFVALVFTDLYSSDAARIGMAETMQNPAMIAMVGPVFDAANYTNGAMYAQMMLVFTIIVVALMNIFLVVRLTRRDEESSRLEVIRSLPVGRLSNLASTLIVCIITNILLAILIALGLSILNINSMDLSGSILFGIILGISGIFWGVLAALFVQVSSTSRGAIAYASAFLGLSYLLRGVGDVINKTLSYLSPLGLPVYTQIFVNNYWWPVLVLSLITVAVAILVFYLNSIRDLGEGLVAARPGPKSASKFLTTPAGLALRLGKPVIIGWAITLALLGASYGSVFNEIENFLEGSPMMQELFLSNNHFTVAEQFMTTLMAISSIVTTVAILIIIFRMISEEKKGLMEQVLTKAVSKTHVLLDYILIAVILSIIFQFLFAFGLWGASAIVMTDPITLALMLKASFAYIPAILLMVSIGTLFIAYLPRKTTILWSIIGVLFFLVYMGELINTPKWIMSLIPYEHIPKIPIDNFTATPLVILTIISGLLFSISLYGYRKRDLM